MRQAVGTSLLVIAVLSTRRSRPTGHWAMWAGRPACSFAVGLLPASALGAHRARRFAVGSPRRAFGWFLTASANRALTSNQPSPRSVTAGRRGSGVVRPAVLDRKERNVMAVCSV